MRKSIMDTLKRFEAETAITQARFDLRHHKLRLKMVEKHGVEWVERIEAEVRENAK